MARISSAVQAVPALIEMLNFDYAEEAGDFALEALMRLGPALAVSLAGARAGEDRH